MMVYALGGRTWGELFNLFTFVHGDLPVIELGLIYETSQNSKLR